MAWLLCRCRAARERDSTGIYAGALVGRGTGLKVLLRASEPGRGGDAAPGILSRRRRGRPRC